jgi:hypothetical protein
MAIRRLISEIAPQIVSAQWENIQILHFHIRFPSSGLILPFRHRISQEIPHLYSRFCKGIMLILLRPEMTDWSNNL